MVCVFAVYMCVCDTQPCKWPWDVVSGYRKCCYFEPSPVGRVDESFEHGILGEDAVCSFILFLHNPHTMGWR